MKNIFIQSLKLLSLVLLLSKSTLANTGFYYGLALGQSHLSGNSTLSVDRTNAGVNINQSHNTKHSASNFHGEIIGGYGQFVDTFWLAGELHFGLSSLETKTILSLSHINLEQPLTIKSSHNSGISFHLGRQMNMTTKAYIKLGAEIRKFSHHFDGKNTHNDNLTNIEKSYYSLAFVPGFGIETEVEKDITMRTEYKLALHPIKKHETVGTARSKSFLKSKSVIHSVNVGIHFKI